MDYTAKVMAYQFEIDFVDASCPCGEIAVLWYKKDHQKKVMHRLDTLRSDETVLDMKQVGINVDRAYGVQVGALRKAHSLRLSG